MINPEVSIIIVSYNTRRELEDCLSAIFQNSQGLNFKVVVVDNHSTDSSVLMVEKKFPKVKLVKNPQNLGFAKAVNQGFDQAESDYYLLLNPDTKVLKDAIKVLVDFAKTKKDLAAVGPKLLNPDGQPQPSCYNLPTIKNAFHEFWLNKKGTFEKFLPAANKPIEVESIVGAAMLIPKRALGIVGFFDERYFMYFEDLDWCRRARENDFKIYWNPNAEIVHIHGAAASKNIILSQEQLRASSKIYHGLLTYMILTLIIRLSQVTKH